MHACNIVVTEIERGPVEGPGVGVFHAVGGGTRKDVMVDEVGEGLEGIFPRILTIMIFRRDLRLNDGGKKVGKDGEEVVKRLQRDGGGRKGGHRGIEKWPA